MKHVGNLEITMDNAKQFEGLEEVTGSLDISAEAALPVLTTVGGYLDIRAEKHDLPSLKSAHGVDGRLVAVKKYGLWYSKEYKWYAGCQGPLTKNQALALSKKWDDQEVAQHFIAAILSVDQEFATE